MAQWITLVRKVVARRGDTAVLTPAAAIYSALERALSTACDGSAHDDRNWAPQDGPYYTTRLSRPEP